MVWVSELLGYQPAPPPTYASGWGERDQGPQGGQVPRWATLPSAPVESPSYPKTQGG